MALITKDNLEKLDKSNPWGPWVIEGTTQNKLDDMISPKGMWFGIQPTSGGGISVFDATKMFLIF